MACTKQDFILRLVFLFLFLKPFFLFGNLILLQFLYIFQIFYLINIEIENEIKFIFFKKHVINLMFHRNFSLILNQSFTDS